MTLTNDTPDTSKQEARVMAVAADPRRVALDLARELPRIDDEIKAVEVEANRATEEAQVMALLQERDRLLQRKIALPFLVRGAQARALRVQATAMFDEAKSAKAEWDTSVADAETSAARLAAAERELKEAIEASAQAVRRRDTREHEYWSLHRSAAFAQGDAERIEQGLEPTYDPHRFLDPE
jgi:hypothetical protein